MINAGGGNRPPALIKFMKKMNYNTIDVDKEVNQVVTAIEKGNYRPATKKESMVVRLGALSEIVYQMQKIFHNDKKLVKV
ncbi:MAG: hypothetical protein FWD78_16285 [Treponema sp.]|nr:hypothetical protein [Treponema sp.]